MPDPIILEAHEQSIVDCKIVRKQLDETLQFLKNRSGQAVVEEKDKKGIRKSRERALCMTKLQEAIMWLGMDMKAINEEQPGSAPNPYPESKNPENAIVAPTSEGLKL